MPKAVADGPWIGCSVALPGWGPTESEGSHTGDPGFPGTTKGFVDLFMEGCVLYTERLHGQNPAPRMVPARRE